MPRSSAKRIVEVQGSLFSRSEESAVLTAGVDEAGRGCFAGPVVAGAVIFPEGFDLVGLDDSKSLSAEERERLSGDIREFALGWGIGLSWMNEIARLNILQASLLAMARALAAMRMRMLESGLSPSTVLVDGTQTIPPLYFRKLGMPVPEQHAIVDGDALVPCISAASILAKTFRDRLMDRLDERWPLYGFARHKGYGTREHREALRRYGPCPLHRLDFHGVLPDADRKKESGQGWLF